MIPTDRFYSLNQKVTGILVGLCFVAAGAIALRLEMPDPVARAPDSEVTPSLLPAPTDLSAVDWSVVQDRGGVQALNMGGLAKRFRLAGTYQVIDDAGHETRRAIIDGMGEGAQQRIVRENEQFDDVTVRRIFQESVVLIGPNGEEQLYLSFSGGSGAEVTSSDPSEMSVEQLIAAGGFDPYGGKRIGENRWLFRRSDLEEYYQQLRDNPERLLKVFDSMKPLYDDERKITGYFLGTEGEKGFFDSVGLMEDDVVRSVNSMEMTNRRRAEYFINEFAAGRVNAFVIDLEREGVKKQFIYEVR